MPLAAITVENANIQQRAGHAQHVTIKPAEGGFILHGVAGPPPVGWVQSPEDVPLALEPVEGGMRVWCEAPSISLRFVPVLPEPEPPAADDESEAPDEAEDERPNFPDPDWTRAPDIRSYLVQQIQQEADAQLAMGALWQGKRWPVDERSMLLATGLVAMDHAGRGLPGRKPKQCVRTCEREKHELNAKQYLDLAEARRDYIAAVLDNTEDLIDQVMSLDGPVSIDITKGWPK